MWRLMFFLIWPISAQACDRPICLVDGATLQLAQTITFDDLPSGSGPGRPVEGLLVMPGAQFGERFAGQLLSYSGDFDRVLGRPVAPLALLPGVVRQNMAILRLTNTNVLSGDGPAGFPNHQAGGEGAIAILFDRDQAALRFDIRGGEGGEATIVFLRRDGSHLDSYRIGPLAEQTYAFERAGQIDDIAGIVLTNSDPDGIALDTLSFDSAEKVS
jgi:hypothetical protein